MIDVTKINFSPLYDYARELVEMYKQELELQKVNASGALSNSADFDFDFNENDITLYFIYNSYGYYVNEGRKPTGSGGGQRWADSVGDIMQWLENKISRGWFVPRNGRQIPRTPQEIKRAATGIVKKIRTKGWYDPNHQGKHILEKVLQKAQANGLIDKMVNSITDQLSEDISVSIEQL